MNSRRFILSIYILCIAAYIFANTSSHYYFRSLGLSEGLSHSTVNVIYQDRIGFMWFGTKDGLNRFDGNSFRVFKKENSGLGNNFITAICEDNEGKMWVGTDAGVYIYDPMLESFEAFDTPIDKLGDTIKRAITCLAVDPDGNIWISSDYQGLFCYNKEIGVLKNYSLQMSHTTSNVTHFWLDNGVMWVGRYEDNLYYSKDNCKTFHVFKDMEGVEPFRGAVIETCAKGLRNCIYIGSSKGLMEINLSTRKVRMLLNEYVRDICFLSDTELWVGTEHGLYIYDIVEDNYVHLTIPDGDDRYALSDNAIYSVFRDNEDGMWIGSYFGGINYYPHQYTYFEKYYPRYDLSYMGRRVREFCGTGDGTVWIGTEDKGLFRFNSKDGSITPFRHSLNSQNIHGLCLDGDYLWVGTFSEGLNRIDLRTQAVKHYAKGEESNTLNADNVFSICRTSTGDLWMGTTSGLLTYNRETDDFRRIPELDNVFVYDIFEDSYGKLWIATYSDGVFCYDLTHNKWKMYKYNPSDSTSLSYNKVISIFEDSKRRLWFTTQGAGICRFQPDTDNFVRYDMSKGFPSNIAYKILEDDNGVLWVSTNKGLVAFKPETGVKRVYTTANGLLSDQFNYQSGYKDENGTFYFGSIYGFVSFNPTSFKENTRISPVILTDFSLFNKRMNVGGKDSPLTKSITFSDALELDADQNSFSLRAVVLSYQANRSNTVLCKLDGFDKDWYTVSGSDSRITYSNLPYGSYTLCVRGANSDGVWNPDVRFLHIRVLPPFYLSWGAYIVYSILLILSITLLVYYLRKRNQRKHLQVMERFHYEKEKELYTAKIDFFTNVAHEIRTPLTLIKSPLENILSSGCVNDSIKDDLEIMDLNTNRLLDLVNQLLDFRKTETKGFLLNFVDCDLSELLQKIYVRFTPLARERKLDFSVHIAAGVYAAVDKEGFTKIVSNLLTNAIKYAGTYIRVELKTEEDRLSLYIKNDGAVIPLNMREEIFKPFVQYHDESFSPVQGTGIGLALARSLAELHGGELMMTDATDYNCFVLTLPLRQENTLHLTYKEDVLEENEDKSTEVKTDLSAEMFRYTLMIVEDNNEMRKFLVRQLQSSYKVVEATNGLEALNLLQESIVNLIISDVMMPEMDGLELCNTLKSELEYSHIPIILLTARATLQSKIDGLKAGADAYVEKPFSMEYLKVCITNLLKNREQLQATFVNTPFVSTNSMAISKADEEFLKKLYELVQENIQNPDFSLVDMAEKLCMSRSSLNRKIKGILNITPNDYIRIERLKKAAQLLKDGSCKVNEVCYMVGFNTPSYFAKCFQKQFGVLPKDFLNQSL